MTDPLRAITVSELLSLEIEGREATGLTEAHIISAGGSYRRTESYEIQTVDLQPQYKSVINQGLQPVQNFDPIYQLCFRDGCVTGQGTVTTSNNFLMLDSCWEFFAQQIVPSGFSRLTGDSLYRHLAIGVVIEDPVFLLKRPWWANYGHWLVDAAAWLCMFDALHLPDKYHIAIGDFVSPDMKRIVEETFHLLGRDVSILKHKDAETWMCRKLYYLSPVQRSPLFKLPQALIALRANILRNSRLLNISKRIYLHRNSAYRQLENEDKIIAICASYGFVVINPETLSLAEQAAMFNQAEIIVGVKGAAFTNLIFSRVSATAVLLSPGDWPDLFFWDIATMLGLQYIEIFGNLTANSAPASHNPFTIDFDVFDGVLRKYLNLMS